MKALAIATLEITSKAFKNNGMIPRLYTCEGRSINPPIEIKNIPNEAKSTAIIVEDPFASQGSIVLWMAWNMPCINEIKENSFPGGIQGLNDHDMPRYMGPCPSIGLHQYFFRIYALDKVLTLDSSCKKNDLEKAMQGHVIGFGELIGVYRRQE